MGTLQTIAASADASLAAGAGPPSPSVASGVPAITSQEVTDAAIRILSSLDGDDDAERDPSSRLAEAIDRMLHYTIAQQTLGLSPMMLGQAYRDWLVHLSMSPGKQIQLLSLIHISEPTRPY